MSQQAYGHAARNVCRDESFRTVPKYNLQHVVEGLRFNE